jgi:mlo protein
MAGYYTLEQTPSWAVAVVVTVVVIISVVAERFIHWVGHKLKEKKQKPLFEALEKLKEELMLMGIMSLLLVVFQGKIINICMPESWVDFMLPCPYEGRPKSSCDYGDSRRRLLSSVPRKLLDPHHMRRLVPKAKACEAGKVHVISLEGLHQLHIFIFVLTCVHVGYSIVTVFLGFWKMRSWRAWEEETRAEDYDSVGALRKAFKLKRTKTYVASTGRHPLSPASLLSWFVSFFRQFGPWAVVKSEYLTLRLGFIVTHNLTNKFDFHSYISRSLEDDFKTVIGISTPLWAFVVIFLLLNVHGWYTYFWIAYLPMLLVLIVGTKLQHIIQQLSLETAQSQGVIGVGIVKVRDSLFWFNRPQVMLSLIHFILFQNAFELAFFLWILTSFGFDSCIMGKAWAAVARLILGTAVQILCSYSTLPLYALVTQMGSHYKQAIFKEKTKDAILGWGQKAKERVHHKHKGGHELELGHAMTARAGDSSGEPYPSESAQDDTERHLHPVQPGDSQKTPLFR